MTIGIAEIAWIVRRVHARRTSPDQRLAAWAMLGRTMPGVRR